MKKWSIRIQAFALLCMCFLLPVQTAQAVWHETEDTKELEKIISNTEEFLFEDGDVVGFIGDSITHVEYTGISYQEFLYNYYITRYPQWTLEFRNLGTASYKASDAVALYGDTDGIQDPAIEGITKAVVMFGMNEALDGVSADVYVENMRRLVQVLEERGLASEDIILVAPTPYDQTRSSNYAEDGGLIQYTDNLICQYVPELEALAQELGTYYVDLHTPMLWVTELVQDIFPDDTLTVTDNVHPNAMGNTLAGYFFLYQQGADNVVSQVTIQEENKTATEHASVKKLKRDGDSYLQFRYQTESLPMAVSYEFHEATQYFEIVDAISWQDLTVEGLEPEMSYTVYMDETAVTTATGAELAEGINLTDCDWNPLQVAAKEMEVLNQEWHRLSSEYRSVVRDATREDSALTQADVDEAYETWAVGTEAVRGEMYAIVRESAAKTYKVEIVREDYTGTNRSETMKKIVAILGVAGLLVGCAAKGADKDTAAAALGEAQVQTAAEEITEEETAEEETKEGEGSEATFWDLFEVQAENMDYLSVEGIRVPEGSVFAMIGKDSESNFWKKVKEGAAQAVDDLNTTLGYAGDAKVELIYDAPEHEDISEQIDIIDQMLDKNPDVLCVGFVDVNSGRTQLDMAQANGIPVLAVDSGVETSQVAVTIQTDNYQAGVEAAKELCAAMGDTGKVALLVHNSQTESGTERERGFSEEIRNNHPDVEIVNIAYRQQEERTVDEIVGAVLMEHPDLKAYFGTNDVTTKEIINALELYAREDSQVLAAGFDASAKEIEALVDDRLVGVMAQNPYAMGYAAAVAAFREMAGMENADEVSVEHYWIDMHNLEEEKAQMLIYK